MQLSLSLTFTFAGHFANTFPKVGKGIKVRNNSFFQLNGEEKKINTNMK